MRGGAGQLPLTKVQPFENVPLPPTGHRSPEGGEREVEKQQGDGLTVGLMGSDQALSEQVMPEGLRRGGWGEGEHAILTVAQE